MEEKGEIVIYQTQDGITKLDVRLDGDTVWLSQEQMAQLFERDKSVITRHISNIYAERELSRESTSAKIAFVPQTRERTYEITYYNLDVIISVGYRVKSQRGVQFRQWATKRIHEYIVKGFTIDDERLKGNGGGQYWRELLQRIQEIRTDEHMRKYLQNFLILLGRGRVSALQAEGLVCLYYPEISKFPIVSIVKIVVLASKLPDSYIKYLYKLKGVHREHKAKKSIYS